jgi:hypothetical protein
MLPIRAAGFACHVTQGAHLILRSLPGITVRLLPLQVTWFDAAAALRQTNRSEGIREAITWLAARESAQVSRTRHYRATGR